MLKKKLRNQKGFTLIEIIAVLVILGILAAVAIPKFFSMQEAAADKVADAGLASAFSALTLGKASNMLAVPTAPADPAAACAAIQLDGSTITSIACVGTSWGTGTTATITVAYVGRTSSPSKVRTWTNP